MAKFASKGVVLKLDIATVLTVVSQVLSLKTPTIRSLDFESTTLDSELFKERDMSGYAEADPFETELWFDLELATQAAILEHVNPADPVNDAPTKSTWQITYPNVTGTNATASTLDFDVAGLEIGESLDMGDGIKRSLKGNIDGATQPVWTV